MCGVDLAAASMSCIDTFPHRHLHVMLTSGKYLIEERRAFIEWQCFQRLHCCAPTTMILCQSMLQCLKHGLWDDHDASRNDLHGSMNDLDVPPNDHDAPRNDPHSSMNDLDVPSNDHDAPRNDPHSSMNDLDGSTNDLDVPSNDMHGSMNDLHGCMNEIQRSMKVVRRCMNDLQGYLLRITHVTRNTRLRQSFSNLQFPISNL
jgi:hypothetical protein